MFQYSRKKFLGNFGKSDSRGSFGLREMINALMLLLFLPVLFCVFFIGNKMNYYDEVKADILVPNALLTLIALVVFAVCLWLVRLGKKIGYTKRVNTWLNLLLIVLFIGFYFFCMALSKETVFNMSVDQGIVREAAKDVARGIPLGYRHEFSIDYNNIPITFILAKLFKLTKSWPWYDHSSEYLWIVVGCLIVTGGGFCACHIVKRLTKNPVAVLLAFGLYLVTAGLCPWKYIPYTDSYGILFPVLCFLLYLYSRDCKGKVGRVVLLFLAFLAGAVGAVIKPSAYLAVIAVLCLEVLDILTAVNLWHREHSVKVFGTPQSVKNISDTMEAPENVKTTVAERKKGRGSLLCSACTNLAISLVFVLALYGATELFTDYIIEDMGLEYNEELESTLQYYFFSSTNELTTGSFTIEDYGVFGEFQYSKADRNAACMERAWARIRERGVFGTMYFCLKKLVKSFNDGTFAWTDVLYYQPFPENLIHDNALAWYLRSLFTPGDVNQGKYDTAAELAWIFVLLGVPGFILVKREDDYPTLFPILLIGILTYLMLFESGARYIYIFLPIFIVMSVCGMERIGELWARKSSERNRGD